MRRLVCLASLLAASCATPYAASMPPPTPPLADPWSMRSWEDRHELMTGFVLPEMAAMFQTFEGKADPDLTCSSCHGRDAEAIAYRMPSTALRALDARALPNPSRSDAEGRWVRFMTDEVTPKLAAMPGRRVHRGTLGVTCFSCHPSRT